RKVLLLGRGKALVEFAELLDISQARIDLRLEKERSVADDFRTRLFELGNHLRMNLARPGPAPYVGDALIVDRDDCYARRGGVTGGAHAPVVSQAFETLDQIAARCEKQH